MKFIACYIRVLANEPNQVKQRREMDSWLRSNRINPKSVRWYVNKFDRISPAPAKMGSAAGENSRRQSAQSSFGTSINCARRHETD